MKFYYLKILFIFFLKIQKFIMEFNCALKTMGESCSYTLANANPSHSKKYLSHRYALEIIITGEIPAEVLKLNTTRMRQIHQRITQLVPDIDKSDPIMQRLRMSNSRLATGRNYKTKAEREHQHNLISAYVDECKQLNGSVDWSWAYRWSKTGQANFVELILPHFIGFLKNNISPEELSASIKEKLSAKFSLVSVKLFLSRLRKIFTKIGLSKTLIYSDKVSSTTRMHEIPNAVDANSIMTMLNNLIDLETCSIPGIITGIMLATGCCFAHVFSTEYFKPSLRNSRHIIYNEKELPILTDYDTLINSVQHLSQKVVNPSYYKWNYILNTHLSQSLGVKINTRTLKVLYISIITLVMCHGSMAPFEILCKGYFNRVYKPVNINGELSIKRPL